MGIWELAYLVLIVTTAGVILSTLAGIYNHFFKADR